MVRAASHHNKEVGGMKYWDSLTDDAKDFLLIAGFLLEFYLLFVVAA